MANNKIRRYGASGWVDVINGDDYLTYATDAGKLVPAAGFTGQVLSKKSDTNHDEEWTTPHYVPAGGVVGAILTKSSATDYALVWAPPSTLFGTATEHVEVVPTSDDKLRIVENTADGRPYLSFRNQNAAGALLRKGYLGFPEAMSDTSDITLRAEVGDLQLYSAAGFNVFADGNRVLTVADMTSSAGNVGITGDMTAANFRGDSYYVGNDARILDVNIANTIGVQGQAAATTGAIKFGSAGPVLSGTGTVLSLNSQLIVTDPGIAAVNIGRWSGGSTYATVEGPGGYVLLGTTAGVNTSCYLRSKGTGTVNLGANGTNHLSISTTTLDALLPLDMNQNNINNGNSIYMDNWFRSTGTTGWYNETYTIGIYATDTDWIRSYGTVSTGGIYAQHQLGTGGSPTGASGATFINGALGILTRYSSSREIKENVSTMVLDAGALIDAMRPVKYQLRADRDPRKEPAEQWELDWLEKDYQYGFIAEELALVDASLCSWEDDTDDVWDGELKPTSWKPHNMITVVVTELKALRRRVADLEEQLGALS